MARAEVDFVAPGSHCASWARVCAGPGSRRIPSYQVKAGDVICVKEKSQSTAKFKEIKEMEVGVPAWLDVNRDKLEGKILADPTREQIDTPIEEHLIVELYSK